MSYSPFIGAASPTIGASIGPGAEYRLAEGEDTRRFLDGGGIGRPKV
jgi:hypothetical protein